MPDIWSVFGLPRPDKPEKEDSPPLEELVEAKFRVNDIRQEDEAFLVRNGSVYRLIIRRKGKEYDLSKEVSILADVNMNNIREGDVLKMLDILPISKLEIV